MYRSAVLSVNTGRIAPLVAVGVSRMDREAEAVLRRFVFDLGFGGMPTSASAAVSGFKSFLVEVLLDANLD